MRITGVSPIVSSTSSNSRPRPFVLLDWSAISVPLRDRRLHRADLRIVVYD